MRRLAFFLLLLSSLSGHLRAAGDDSTASPIRADLSALGADAARVLTAPLRFSGRDWAIVGGVLGGTALATTLDRSARAAARDARGATLDPVMDIGREYGREMYGLSLAGGLYVGGLAFGSERVRTTGRMLFESVALAGLTNMVLKSAFGRSRPQTGEGPYRFHGFQTALERTSLPSGHTTVAFSVSSVLARRIGNPYATAGLYGLATVTAVSRIYHDNHWLSDTFLGAAIGTAVGLAVTGEGAAGDLTVAPTPSGLLVAYRW